MAAWISAPARAVAASGLTSQVPASAKWLVASFEGWLVGVRAAERRRVEALGARQAEVGLGRRQARRVHGALRLGHRARVGMAGLLQERPDVHLGAVVLALAEVRVADLAAGVDQVLGGPVLVAQASQVASLLSCATG